MKSTMLTRVLIKAGVFLCGILLCTLSLLSEHLSLTAVCYALFLLFLPYLIYTTLHYYREMTRAKKVKLLQHASSGLPKNFPNAKTSVEVEYQALCVALIRKEHEKYEQLLETLKETQHQYMLWSHQMKTPLATAKLLLANAEDSLSRDVKEQLFHMEQYVNTVLWISRLASPQMDFSFHRFPLQQILQNSIKKYSRLFVRKGLSLSLDIPQISVVSDRKWLQFILEQLLDNAIKYTEKGSVTIHWVVPNRLAITDTGIGIPEEDIPRLFQLSYTGHNGHKTQRASGLGLYLCRSVCEKLGHSLTVSSAKGTGTTFFLQFLPEHITLP